MDVHQFRDGDGALYLCCVNLKDGFKISVQPMADPVTKRGMPTEVIRPTVDWERKKGAAMRLQPGWSSLSIARSSLWPRKSS